ncbi:hypothetical protein BXZ70DRAFT_922212 [Cristinia sonorae]|uniref:Uncharacterized protein n=1 Tax=Cristinia sonorae TaxID=1940300 RepID=A0A8K0XSW8_9AGAR|nr:hypothetical protein BXZ70DRAFT_922212 [Cristinia sonorae]
MNFIMNLVFFFLATLSTFSTALPLQRRDVFVPHILYPREGTVWFVGQTHNVTWDTSDAPTQITNPRGTIILARNGRLDLDHPLASNFSILDGRHEIKVPNVPEGDVYNIVLFGDSGNFSGNFTIKH